jgi:hypothetical protein
MSTWLFFMVLRSVIRRRGGSVIKTPIYRDRNDGPCSAGWQGLPMILTGLGERMTTDLRNLSATLGTRGRGAGQRCPTRILILDEGVADTRD